MPLQYSCVRSAAGSTYVARFPDTIADSFPVTLAGWVRLVQSPLAAPEVIFSKSRSDGSLSVTLSIGTDGLLVGTASGKFTDGSPRSVLMQASTPISDTVWHYVMMLVGADVGVSLCIDGLSAISDDDAPAAAANMSPKVMAFDTPAGVFLNPGTGASDSGLAFASWMVWSSTLTLADLTVPNYMAPAPGTPEAAGLALAVNFANGPATDTSGNNVVFDTIAPTNLTPSLRIGTGGNAEVVYQVLPIAEPGAFSMAAWFLRTGNPVMSLLNCVGATQSFDMTIADQTMTITRTGQDSTGPRQLQFATAVPETGWIHVAVVTDTTTITLYIDSVVRQVFDCTGIAAWGGPITGPIYLGRVSGTAPDSGALQDVSLWTTCLGGADVVDLMNYEDPVPGSGSAAIYPMLVGIVDEVSPSTSSLGLTNAALQDDGGFVPGTPMAPSIHITSAVAPPAPKPSGEPMLLDYKTLRRVAEQYAHAIPAVVSRDTLAAHLVPSHDWYENSLAKLPPETAAPLRAAFLRDLHLGEAKRLAGDRTGTFEFEPNGGKTIVYYHDLDGRHAVHVIDALLSERGSTVLKIVVDSFAILFAIFGVYAAASALARAVESWFGPILDGLIWAIAWKTSTAVEVVGGIVKWIYLVGRLPAFVIASISANYWSMLFAALSFTAQAILMFVSGGAALVQKIAQLGLGIGQLTTDIIKFNGLPPDLAVDSDRKDAGPA